MTPVFQHITVPIDGSTTSERGVAFALELGGTAARISFCSVVDPMLAYAPAAYGVALDPGPMIDVLDDDAAVFCRRAKSRRRTRRRSRHIRSARAVHRRDRIVRRTERLRCGRDRNARPFGSCAGAALGSVAKAVLRHMQIPVVTGARDRRHADRADRRRAGFLAGAKPRSSWRSASP